MTGKVQFTPAEQKDIAIFKSENIRAMGPAAQGIAALLKDAGWIKIVDEPETRVSA